MAAEVRGGGGGGHRRGGDKPTSLASLVPSPRGARGVDMAEDGRSVVYSGRVLPFEEEEEEAEEGKNSGATQKPAWSCASPSCRRAPRPTTSRLRCRSWPGERGGLPNNGEDTVDVRVLFRPGCAPATAQERTKLLKLTAKESLRNMNLFSAEGRLEHYDTAEDIVRAHAAVRLATYEQPAARARCRGGGHPLDKCRAMQRRSGASSTGRWHPSACARRRGGARARRRRGGRGAAARGVGVGDDGPRRRGEARGGGAADGRAGAKHARPSRRNSTRAGGAAGGARGPARAGYGRREGEDHGAAGGVAQQAEKATKGKRSGGRRQQAAVGRRKAEKAARSAKAAGDDGGRRRRRRQEEEMCAAVFASTPRKPWTWRRRRQAGGRQVFIRLRRVHGGLGAWRL